MNKGWVGKFKVQNFLLENIAQILGWIVSEYISSNNVKILHPKLVSYVF